MLGLFVAGCTPPSARPGDRATDTKPAHVWREDSFEDFRDGTFSDGGANMYVSHRGRIQTVTRWDLNSDSYIDIVMANSHLHTEGLNLAIFWGNGKDFDSNRGTLLPTDGSLAAQAADVNADGAADLVVANEHNGTRFDSDAFVYLNRRQLVVQPSRLEAGGTPAPHTGARFGIFERMAGLPSKRAVALAASDLNKDGHVDVVLAFAGSKVLEKDGKKSPSIHLASIGDLRAAYPPTRFRNCLPRRRRT